MLQTTTPSRDKPLYVLLSTYNGEKYLDEMLASLYDQSYTNVKILVRDDGSTDSTVEILKKSSINNKNISIFIGENIGVVKSYFELLKIIPEDAYYMAFCDQDDLWEKDKLTRAVLCIDEAKQSDLPIMYASCLKVVNESLTHLWTSLYPKKGASFENALMQNIAAGCSMVFNRAAWHFLSEHIPCGKMIAVHDWWAYLAISAVGSVVYDRESRLLYRQHCSNTIGVTKGWKLLAMRVKRFVANRHQMSYLAIQIRQAQALKKNCYAFLSADKKNVLDQFISCASSDSFLVRLAYVFGTTVHRQKSIDTLFCKLLILFYPVLNRN